MNDPRPMIKTPPTAVALATIISLPATTLAVHLLENARIYTVNDAAPWAEALAIEAGTIVAIGSTTNVRALYPNPANVTDMGGRLVLPGFQDAHLHAVEAGVNAGICFVDEDAPVADLSFYFDDCPDGGLFGDQGWIVGAGIDIGGLQETLALDPNQEFPITILDRDYPDTPVLILDRFGHGAIANTKAMQAVGYNTLVGDPPGGIVGRDPDTGGLTGIVLENAQQKLRDKAFPPTAVNQQKAYDSLLNALDLLKSNGITSVSDAGGFWRQAQTEAWAQAENDGKMTVRASNALYIYPDTPLSEQLPDLMSRYSNDPTKLVRFNQAKIYVDGILSLSTSALYNPYEADLGLPTEKELGFEYFGNATRLNQVCKTLADNGFQLHFHVTGDRGAGLALDAIAQLGAKAFRHRLTHCFLVDPSDRQRFTQFGTVADFQIAPSSVNPANVEFLRGFIGSTRANQLIPAVEVYNTGALLTISSDWDADTLSPLVKIKTALTRADGRSFPDVASVIPLMTRNAGLLLGTNTGTLEVGKAADIIALDQNIFEIPFSQIDQASVVLTIFGGQVIYDPTGIVGAPITIAPTPAPPDAGSGASSVPAAWATVLSISFALLTHLFAI